MIINKVLTNEEKDFNKKEFIRLLKDTKREGIDKLIEWLETTDFFDAPASSKFHGNYPGGLCQHSLLVLDYLLDFCYMFLDGVDCEGGYEESIVIVALLHDLCKVNTYKEDVRNVKVDGKWTQVPYYKHDPDYHFGGHGAKSVYYAMKYIKLTDTEAAAINAHMGLYDKTQCSQPEGVYDNNILALLLHIADTITTHIEKV